MRVLGEAKCVPDGGFAYQRDLGEEGFRQSEGRGVHLDAVVKEYVRTERVK